MSTNKQSGFTLMETMVAAAIMATALVAAASMFAYAMRTNVMTEQMTTATFLVNSKLEDIRGQQFSTVAAGGGLDVSSPTTNYFEYITVDPNGTVTTSTTNTAARFIRLWEVSTATSPRLITVAVFARNNGVSGQTTELARATMELSNGL